jgi:hypothetical protein
MGFLAIYSRLKNKRSIVIKTKKAMGGGGKSIEVHSIIISFSIFIE